MLVVLQHYALVLVVLVEREKSTGFETVTLSVRPESQTTVLGAFVVVENESSPAAAAWSEGYPALDGSRRALPVCNDKPQLAVLFNDVEAFYVDFLELRLLGLECERAQKQHTANQGCQACIDFQESHVSCQFAFHDNLSLSPSDPAKRIVTFSLSLISVSTF